MHESILVYGKLRYLKVALALAALSAVAYVLHTPLGPPNGATWLGYTLGGISGGLMVWLAWFGIKKRTYGAGRLSAQEWLSAHVYLGTALAFVATLHAGFRFGANIHTVLYVLMMIVIISGMVGVYFYLRYPRLLTENRRGLSSEVMLAQLADLDREIRQLAMGLDDATNTLALNAIRDTIVGGSLANQLRGFDPHCPTTVARMFVERSSFESTSEQDAKRRQLLMRLVRKEEMLKRIRRDVQLRCVLRVWLYVHVPFSIAALMALVAHVVTEFYYW
ncbi:MAG: hypothetical protein EPO08_00805 [Rhodospirillaceae bacterium]|nr:MAG: hypothetical protein EPO08_00805 [Rhodospirillaceae bacterium]